MVTMMKTITMTYDDDDDDDDDDDIDDITTKWLSSIVPP